MVILQFPFIQNGNVESSKLIYHDFTLPKKKMYVAKAFLLIYYMDECNF